MYNEPEIVKELREEEKQGKLKINYSKIERINQNGLSSIEEKFYTLFENYTVGITVADKNEQIVSWNNYAEELFNMTGNELHKKHVSLLYPEEEWEKIRALDVRQKGMKYKFETMMKRKGEENFPAEISIAVLRGPNGQIKGSLGIINDVSKLIQTKEKLYKSKQKYKTIFENSPVSIMLTDENEKIVSWNKYTEKMLNMKHDDLYMKKVSDIYPKEEWKKIRKENVREKGMQHHLETKIKLKNQKLLDVDVSLSVLRNKNNNIIGSIGIIRDISKRKIAEKKLKESEENYRTIFENSAVAIMKTDKNERIVDCNDFAEKLLNTTKEELLNKPIKELYPLIEWKKIREQNIRQKGMQHHLETKIKRRNNEPLDVDISISVLRNLENEITGSIGIIRDISSRKKAEQKLKSILEYSNDSMYLIDKNLVYLTVNKELLKRLDLKRDDVVGHRFDEIHTKQETDDFKKKINWVIKNGKSTKDEHKCSKLNRWFLRTLSPVKDSLTNETISIAVISKDITDIKKTEQKLKQSEERYRTIFENSAVAIMLTDENEKIVSWNKFTEEMLGMNKKDLFGKSVKELYPNSEWKKIRKQNIRQKGMQHHLETKIFNKKQEKIDVDISLSVIKNEDEKIIGSIGVFRNITKRKKAEKKLNEAQKILSVINKQLEKKVKVRTEEIQRLLKQKDEFIYQLGHDLKTPLTPLNSLLPIVHKKEGNEQLKKYLNLAIQNVDYMKNLVEKTLKLALLNSHSFKLDIEEIKPWEIIDKAITNIDSNLENKIIFNNNVKKDIFIKVDKVRFEELINNLISNSIKYSPEGGKITINAKEEQNMIKFSIKDTGCGLTKEQSEKVFEEFYKTDESRHDFNSSGLGLTICKRIVEKHGGKIWVESPGIRKGSTFYFTLKR